MVQTRDLPDTRVQGEVAHDAAIGANPVIVGGEARTTIPTAVGSGDAVRLMADDNGRLVAVLGAPRDLVGSHFKSLSVSTTKTLAPAGGAGVLRDLVSLVVSNPSSASEAVVIIYDNIAAGAEKFNLTIPVAAGPQVISFPVPFPATAANVAWGIKSSVVGTTVTALFVNNN